MSEQQVYYVIHTLLAIGLGWLLHMLWGMLVALHDAKKDRQIEVQTREIMRLRAQLDARPGAAAGAVPEAPLPLSDTAPAPMDTAPAPMDSAPAPGPQPAPRKRRSPAIPAQAVSQPARVDTAKVSKNITQAEIGRMQAQLSAFGKCRAVFTGWPYGNR